MKDIFEHIAIQEGISVEEVKREMQMAIKEAKRQMTPQGESFWNEISPNSEDVSVEDFILHCAKLVTDNFK